MKQVRHQYIVMKGIRSGLLFVLGFYAYEFLMELKDPTLKRARLGIKSRILKFIVIVIIDIIILHILYSIWGEYY
jgi:hypothetical protein